ncbi:DUF5753 domain-containing protein [Actinomadura syzygii]|uniref:Transcriptional regulator n=1 Tax=Actinomadura syzygii TaxID=1427538 RepID=A0A5D0UKX7_9ACTN|nr:DUF5753 domain-containing protein [Actinomadura syzygii]TYC18470.1 transcriptional regulator [Actinomadura syzygii]
MTVALGGQLIAQLYGQMSADEALGPTMPRLLLGARLRRLRKQRGLHRQDAARVVGSEARLVSMELGLIGSLLDDVVALCDLYEVEEHGTRVVLVEMARQSRRPGWWQPFRQLIPAWFLPYLGSEQTAGVIRSYAVQSIPDLLQTPDYARAQLSSLPDKITDEQMDLRVQLRMRRQRILHSDQPTRIWTIIDEAALRRPLGGPVTMRRQLEHLRGLCTRSNIAVQVLPFELGGHPALGGPITMLRWRTHELRDLVFLEQLDSAVYPLRPGDRDYYRHAMNLLGTQAPPPERTPAILDQLINSM